MLLKDIKKDQAEKLITAISDLRPDIRIRIVAEDEMLFKLGFTQYLTCSVDIDMSEEAVSELVEEVQQMEIDAYNYDERKLKDPVYEKGHKELMEKYEKYAVILGYLESYDGME